MASRSAAQPVAPTTSVGDGGDWVTISHPNDWETLPTAAVPPRNPSSSLNLAIATPRSAGDVIDQLAARHGLRPGAVLSRPPGSVSPVDPNSIGDTHEAGPSYLGAGLRGLASIPLSAGGLFDDPMSGAASAASQAAVDTSSPSSGTARNVLATMPMLGHQLHQITGPAAAAAENRPPTRQENADAIEGASATIPVLGMMDPAARSAVIRMSAKLLREGHHPSVRLNSALAPYGPSPVDSATGINVGESLGREGIAASNAADLHAKVTAQLGDLESVRDSASARGGPVDIHLEHRIANLQRASEIAAAILDTEKMGGKSGGGASTGGQLASTAGQLIGGVAGKAISVAGKLAGGRAAPRLPKSFAETMRANASLPTDPTSDLAAFSRGFKPPAAPPTPDPTAPTGSAMQSLAATADPSSLPPTPGAESIGRPAIPQPVSPRVTPQFNPPNVTPRSLADVNAGIDFDSTPSRAERARAAAEARLREKAALRTPVLRSPM